MLLVRQLGGEIEDWRNDYLIDFHALDAIVEAEAPLVIDEEDEE